MRDRVKVNTGTPLFVSMNIYSHAQVVRDRNGNLIKAMSKFYQGTVTPELAEAMEICKALSWVKTKQQTNVIIETNFLVLVQWSAAHTIFFLMWEG